MKRSLYAQEAQGDWKLHNLLLARDAAKARGDQQRVAQVSRQIVARAQKQAEQDRRSVATTYASL
jgi:hypothetical protein